MQLSIATQGHLSASCPFIYWGQHRAWWCRTQCVHAQLPRQLALRLVGADHFEHASTPSFGDAAAVEHFGDPWVPGFGLVGLKEHVGSQAKVQFAGRDDF